MAGLFSAKAQQTSKEMATIFFGGLATNDAGFMAGLVPTGEVLRTVSPEEFVDKNDEQLKEISFMMAERLSANS